MNINLICPFCNQNANIFVEVESHSEYFYSKECENCSKNIDSFEKNGKMIDLDVYIMEEVGERIVCEAEYRKDCLSDR